MTASAKWYLAIVVVILAVIVAVLPRLVTSGGDTVTEGDGLTDEASTSTVVASRPDCPATGAAGVELPCLGAAEGDQTGKPTLVNVWAWWCEPCRTELPVFDQFALAHPDYDVVGVHADANAANGAMMLNDLGISLPSYQDDSNRFAGTLGLPSVVPITVLVSEGGEVLATFPRPFDSVVELETAVQGAHV